jgi:hypothetical protein
MMLERSANVRSVIIIISCLIVLILILLRLRRSVIGIKFEFGAISVQAFLVLIFDNFKFLNFGEPVCRR